MISFKSDLEKLEDIKNIIVSLLIANSDHDIKIQHLNRIYREVEDEDIPFQQFNFTSLKSFLYSLSDAVILDYNKNNELCIYPEKSEKSQHISELVKKQKKSPLFAKENSRYPPRCNLIDPHILFEVLNDAYLKNMKCVKKSFILSEINNHLDVRSFHTQRDLSSQLNELTHLMAHDDDFIYFNEDLFEKKCVKKSLKKSQRIKEATNHSNQQNLNKNCQTITKPKIQMKSISDFVKTSTKLRLQKLIEKRPEGILCCNLPKEYFDEFRLDLEYIDLGFNSILEFIEAIPDILHIDSSSEITNKMKVFDSRMFKSSQVIKKLSSKPSNKISDGDIKKQKCHSSNLSWEHDKLLVSDDSVTFNESVDQINISSISRDSEKSLKVIVTEVHNPSYFWVVLYNNRKDLKKLMIELQDFYESHDLNQFSIPETVLQPGLHITCKFSGIWHRGIIKKIGSRKLTIFFYDYGTLQKYNSKEIFLLDKKFTQLPAQAILCSLSNVKPRKNEENKWPHLISQQFLEKVLNKPFYAYVSSVDQENNSITVTLIDRHYNPVSEWMIKEKLAKYGEVVCLKKNVCFKYY